MSGPRWMMPGEVYAYRTRKPGAVLGLPLLGRHWGYVGQTRNPKARHGEHMNGGGRYGKPAANWSDLSPKRYVLFRLGHCPQWLLNLVELIVIRLLLPVYNDRMNRGNPRRITRRKAARQRAQRDFIVARGGPRGWSWNFTLGHALALVVLVVMVVRTLQS